MLDRGLLSFLAAKNVKTNQAITMFLQSEEITGFTSRNHRQVNSYIQNNWNKFATFIDKSIKSGKLNGTPVKLNYYYEEERQRREAAQIEYNAMPDDVKRLWKLITKYDDKAKLSKCASFFGKRGLFFPKNDDTATSAIARNLPKLMYMIESGYYEELIEHLTNQKK